jgi:uncharacterized membrane protein YdjX (TVP38/TMEM64 family)
MRRDRIHSLAGMTNHQARLLHALWLFVTFPYRPAVAAPIGIVAGGLFGGSEGIAIGLVAAFLIATPVSYLLKRVGEHRSTPPASGEVARPRKVRKKRR